VAQNGSRATTARSTTARATTLRNTALLAPHSPFVRRKGAKGSECRIVWMCMDYLTCCMDDLMVWMMSSMSAHCVRSMSAHCVRSRCVSA